MIFYNRARAPAPPPPEATPYTTSLFPLRVIDGWIRFAAFERWPTAHRDAIAQSHVRHPAPDRNPLRIGRVFPLRPVAPGRRSNARGGWAPAAPEDESCSQGGRTRHPPVTKEDGEDERARGRPRLRPTSPEDVRARGHTRELKYTRTQRGWARGRKRTRMKMGLAHVHLLVRYPTISEHGIGPCSLVGGVS